MTNNAQTPRTDKSIFAEIDQARLVAYGRHLRSVEIWRLINQTLHWLRGRSRCS